MSLYLFLLDLVDLIHHFSLSGTSPFTYRPQDSNNDNYDSRQRNKGDEVAEEGRDVKSGYSVCMCGHAEQVEEKVRAFVVEETIHAAKEYK